jgi:hypothetical protein
VFVDFFLPQYLAQAAFVTVPYTCRCSVSHPLALVPVNAVPSFVLRQSSSGSDFGNVYVLSGVVVDASHIHYSDSRFHLLSVHFTPPHFPFVGERAV